MIDGIYQCVNQNEYGFKLGKNYEINRESEIYLPNSEDLEFIDVIVFEGEQWVPKHDFHSIFKKLDYIRMDKIESILNDTKTTN